MSIYDITQLLRDILKDNNTQLLRDILKDNIKRFI